MARITSVLFALTAFAGLAACAYPYGGYGGVSVGYGSGYYDDYYGYGYGAPYYGWYDGYYYPGVGYYVYDRGGHRHKWDDHHRRHWEGRREGRDGRENWADFRRDSDGNADGRPQWGNRERTQRQAYQDGRGRNAGDAGGAGPAAAPSPSQRSDSAARGGWRGADRAEARPERPANRGHREAQAQTGRSAPRVAAGETGRAERPAPRNRGEAMRRMRDGND